MSLTSATSAAAKSVAALVDGGPSIFDRWARARNKKLREHWGGSEGWIRGTQFDNERAIIYRTLKYPPGARDINPTLLCRTRLTEKVDVPFDYKGRPNWAALQDLYQAVWWRELGLSLSVPQKGNKEEIDALGTLLGWNKALIASYYDRAITRSVQRQDSRRDLLTLTCWDSLGRRFQDPRILVSENTPSVPHEPIQEYQSSQTRLGSWPCRFDHASVFTEKQISFPLTLLIDRQCRGNGCMSIPPTTLSS